MDYKDFFKPGTIANLNKKSAENLKAMLGDKNLMQATMESSALMDQISKAEAPYKDKLEKLAVGMVKELYPIIDDQGIQVDAKIGTTSDITRGLDEAASPEASRRIINSITQGAALRGTFLFFLFKEHLDDLDPTLVEKYNRIMKNVFGVYDDENAIAMMLAMIARGQKTAGGLSKVRVNEAKSRFTIEARASNFPMLVHELIKGVYEVLSKKGFKGDKASNQAVVDKVDLLKNEPDDLRYGKFIYDALNKIFVNSEYNDPRIREFFFIDVYQLSDEQFLEFVENAINEELTDAQIRWANNTLREINDDLKADDYDATGLSEIKVNSPDSFERLKKNLIKIIEHDKTYLHPDDDNIDLEALEDVDGTIERLEAAKTEEDLKEALYHYTLGEKAITQYYFDLANYKIKKNNPLINEITVNSPGNKKLNITLLNKGYGHLYFKDNKWFNQENWDKYTQSYDILFAIPYKNYTYIYSSNNENQLGPQGRKDSVENNLKELKSFLAKKGIQSQLAKWHDLIALKIERKYYNLIKSDGTPLDEIKINAPGEPLDAEKNNIIRDEIAKQLKEIILDFYGTYIDIILDNPLTTDLLYQFIKDQMVFNHYEILRNGEEILVTFNNQNMVKEQDILEYIDEHPEIKKFLENTAWSFYFDNIDFNKIFAECIKATKSDNDISKRVFQRNIKYIVSDILTDLPSTYPEDLFYTKQHEFEDYLKEKLKNPDLMNEIKINEPGISAQIIKKYIKDNVDPSNMGHVKVLNSVNKKYFDTNNVTTKMIDSMSPKKMAGYFSTLKKRLGAQSLTEAYSEGTVNKTIERWKAENPNTDETLAKQLIQRFDQVKAGLASKLDILVLPDELKQGQNYLNIDKYSFDDMIKLIRSIPENPDKIKKDAVAKFVQQDGIDRATAQSYVARFIYKKDDLKYAAENGTEDGAFSKEEVRNFIPKRLLASNTYLDPRAWSWQPFEQMLDALFPSQKTVEDGGENLASTDADKVYDKNGIEIYKGDDVNKCISYNPVNPDTKRKKYGWCVTQVGNTNYDYYRFREASPTFYFIFDRDKTSTPEHAPFDDQWHAFVIQVNTDGQSYVVTGGDNRGDIPAKSWEDISKIVPSDTWAKIKDLKDYFKPIALSPVERGRKFAAGKNLSLDEFKELSQDEKILYIQGKASKNQISDDILKVLPQYKIDYEGRSTTLANVAIDSGQKFPYSVLKDNEALSKRYAIFRFRHTNYGKDPIPLPFVKYLDDDAKQKYLDVFTEDNLTFDYIEKFFGEAATQKYVDDQVKKLDYLPKEALRYITDPKIKKFYEIYAKLYSNWSLSNEKLSNLSDEELGNVATMPKVDINPAPMNLKQWQDLSPAEKKLTIELAKKYDQNLDYSTLIYALPFIIEDGSKTYALVPTSGNDYFYNNWVLADLNGNVVKEVPGSSLLGSYDLVGGYPSADDNYKRVWNINDLKVK
jgi:hypothetical protein